MMQLLISTPLQIFVVNAETGDTSILRSGDGYYFGMTHSHGTIVLSHSGGHLNFYRGGKPETTINHLVQPHQIEWVEDKILVANTGKNCISVIDERGKLCRDVFLNEIRWDDKDHGRLGNHFNSIHRKGDRIYLVAHNYDKPSEVWELTWPGLEIVGTTVTKASWAHDVWIGEYGMVICNSKHGNLYEVQSGEVLWDSGGKEIMTRGLAVSDNYLFVGRSMYSERKTRAWKTGGLWIIDRKTLKTIDQITLPGSGDVQEIRLIDHPDECHNDQIISGKSLEKIRNISPIINWAYQMRRSHPSLQKDVFPLSQIVRFVQMIPRWRRSLFNKELN